MSHTKVASISMIQNHPYHQSKMACRSLKHTFRFHTLTPIKLLTHLHNNSAFLDDVMFKNSLVLWTLTETLLRTLPPSLSTMTKLIINTRTLAFLPTPSIISPSSQLQSNAQTHSIPPLVNGRPNPWLTKRSPNFALFLSNNFPKHPLANK